jgi:hypothetical protein
MRASMNLSFGRTSGIIMAPPFCSHQAHHTCPDREARKDIMPGKYPILCSLSHLSNTIDIPSREGSFAQAIAGLRPPPDREDAPHEGLE